MDLRNPTMDAEKFARQLSRIRERDAERASCSRNAPVATETEAPCTESEHAAWIDFQVATLLDAYRLDPVKDAEAFFDDSVPQEDIDQWKAAMRAKRDTNAEL